MEENWIYKAHLLGHSMGGKVVMQFALSNPDMVSSLCVADIAPKPYSGGHELVFKALQAVPLDEVSSRQAAEDILKAYLAGDQGTVSFLMKNLNRLPHGIGFEWKMNIPVIEASYEKILGNIDLRGVYESKSLFIIGGNSKYVLEEDFENILTYFPTTGFVTIADAGHWVHAEQPDVFYDAYMRFLNPL